MAAKKQTKRTTKRTTKRATKRKQAKPKQLTFDDSRKPDGKHGGWRPGAGRPSGRTVVAHDTRDELASRHPNLVTWRLVADLPSLRQARYADIINAGIAAVHNAMFRITDFSIQTNHLHLVCEASAASWLGDGMVRLAGRIANRLNRVMDRGGDLFEERYHARALRTPREVKNALRYVINNERHHAEERHFFYHPDWIDPFSSALWFDGWRRSIDMASVDPALPARRVTAEPHTWLRRVGWRRWGVLDFDEIPGGE